MNWQTVCSGHSDDPYCADEPIYTYYEGGFSGGGSAPASDKGGTKTIASGTGRTAWQYLKSVWGDCLTDFEKDSRFDLSEFQGLLNGGMKFLDTRNSGIAAAPVGNYAGNGDGRSLSTFLNGADAAVILGTNWVVLGPDYYTNLTQTQQVALAIHEALHIEAYSWGGAFQSDPDGALKNWLTDVGGFTASPVQGMTGDITDWIVGTADQMSTSGGGCKKP
jgi:hypothetical protein